MSKQYHVEPVVLDNTDLEPPVFDGNLYENRGKAYYMYDRPDVPFLSIVVQGYNRLEKTKYAVECILKYVEDMSYELILIDNGSSDGTYDFFQSVPHENKVIVKVKKNIGSGYPGFYYRNILRGKYAIIISNDIYLTKNAIKNLIFCLESDPTIGWVAPMSSNVSNYQQVKLGYDNFDDMQKKAAIFNVCDPSKWEERMRLISTLIVARREAEDIVGKADPAFVHDFGEDDLCARIRRAGYKCILCGDTFICHDHDIWNNEDKDPLHFKNSLKSGRRIYSEKYHGIDAWDDISNYERIMFSLLDDIPVAGNHLETLVVDGRCGTPVLEIRNHMRKRGITDIASYAFTTQAKYYLDLQTVSDDVKCDRIDFIQSHYANDTFDIVAMCEPINIYPSPIVLLQRLYDFLKPGGALLFKLRNTGDYNSFRRSVGLEGDSDGDLPATLPWNEVEECLKLFGGKNISIINEAVKLSETELETLREMLSSVNPGANQNDLAKLVTKDYIFRVVKG